MPLFADEITKLKTIASMIEEVRQLGNDRVRKNISVAAEMIQRCLNHPDKRQSIPAYLAVAGSRIKDAIEILGTELSQDTKGEVICRGCSNTGIDMAGNRCACQKI